MAWTRGPTIGRGSSATVSLATTSTGGLFAVKSTNLSSSTLLQKEEHLISQLCSPFVIKCLGSDTTCENNKHMYNLFLEYIPGGTLSDQLKKQGGLFDETTIRFYAHQLVLGLNYLHQNGVVHCDIKGQNILICDDGLKIADFGCARSVESTSAFAGTVAYMAPEVARGEEQSFAADIWSVGCTVIEMATGSHPWPEMKDAASALYRIGFSEDVPESASWFSDDAKDFVAKCLMKDPRERWAADELLQHPFFKSVEENCGEFTRKSPTSVTDQGFWDAFEATDTSRNSTEIGLFSDSPAGRIMALIGDAMNFTEDEQEWLTVRDNEFDECSNMNEDLEDFNETVSASIEVGIQIRTSIVIEDSTWDCFDGDFCVKDFLYLELSISRIILVELFLHQDQLLLQLFNPFSFASCSSSLVALFSLSCFGFSHIQL